MNNENYITDTCRRNVTELNPVFFFLQVYIYTYTLIFIKIFSF